MPSKTTSKHSTTDPYDSEEEHLSSSFNQQLRDGATQQQRAYRKGHRSAAERVNHGKSTVESELASK
jgi:hypothetical protein